MALVLCALAALHFARNSFLCLDRTREPRNTESRPDMSSPFPPPRPQRFHSDSWNDSSSSGLPEGFLSLGRILNVREDAGMNLVKDEVRPQAPVCGGLHVMAIPRGPFKERAVRAKRGQPKLSA